MCQYEADDGPLSAAQACQLSDFLTLDAELFRLAFKDSDNKATLRH